MAYINLIYFIILTFYAYNFLVSDGKIVKGAFNKDASYCYTGPELFWCLTFATGLVALSGNFGLDLMAIRLMAIIILCLIGLSRVENKPVWSFPLKVYCVYLGWIIIGCFYSPSVGYGIRVVLKYSYPLIFCLFASAAVRHPEVFFKSSLFARNVAVISVLVSLIHILSIVYFTLFNGVFWYATALAIHYISIMCFSLAMFFFTEGKARRWNLFFTVFFLLPCFLWVFRTSIMGSLVAIMAFSFIRYKLKSLPIIIGILILGVVAVFTIPSLKEKMFYDQEVTIQQFQDGELKEDNINTNARAAMWEYLLERFYDGHELTGSGTGSVQQHMYNNYLFGGLRVPHSDFVQMRCDNGLIGLILYGCVAFFIFCHSFLMYQSTDWTPLKICALVAGSSIAGVFVTLYSDNTVNYSMATLSMPFGFYGMMLGLKQSENDK